MHTFRSPSSEFVYLRTYSRWLEEAGRRETWEETVSRYTSFIKEQRPDIPKKAIKKISQYMMSMDVLPSMRFLWTAGPAVLEDNTCIYNCSFLKINRKDAFGEALYILMNGTGVGFSVEGYTELPEVPIFDDACKKIISHEVQDSKAGWADSLKVLVDALYSGNGVQFSYSKLRPKGARLKTFGGRASGPEPLYKLHSFITETFHGAQGRKLTELELHDILCEIAEVVVVGGTRRSALISLSPLKSPDMRDAKNWPFPLRRAMANNSAIYDEKPSVTDFMEEWGALIKSQSGERGIFNREAARKRAPKRRDSSKVSGTNPCGEIQMRDQQFCNLSTIIVRPEDNIETLLDKVETATWLGTIQASFTYLPYLNPEWKKNCEEETLLGVSLSGQMDNRALLQTPGLLKALKDKSIRVNKKASKILGINPSVSITCGKPEGTTSQVTSSGSGCHPWFSKFFIRRYRISSNDPLFKLLKSEGLSLSPENGQDEKTASTWVVSFPCKAPEGAILRDQISALEQLEWYKFIQEEWCEHNQSITVYVKPEEWLDVGAWVYRHWDIVNGVSFLPYDNGAYQQAPYEEITEDQYQEMVDKFPDIDYSKLSQFEKEDQTEGSKTFACVGDKCEIS